MFEGLWDKTQWSCRSLPRVTGIDGDSRQDELDMQEIMWLGELKLSCVTMSK